MQEIEMGGRHVQIEFAAVPQRNGGKLIVEMTDEREISSIAPEWEGHALIKRTDSRRPGVEETYSGYTQLLAVQKMGGGVVRVTLGQA